MSNSIPLIQCVHQLENNNLANYYVHLVRASLSLSVSKVQTKAK